MLKFAIAVIAVVLCHAEAVGQSNKWFADFNDDAKVDYADFVIWANHYGQYRSEISHKLTSGNSRADLNSDGMVDFADFLLFGEAFMKPVWRKTTNGLWLTAQRGSMRFDPGNGLPKYREVAKDSLSLYLGCPPEWNNEPTIIFHRHDGNQGTPKEWYVRMQFLAGSKEVQERYDVYPKRFAGKRVGDFLVFNKSTHRDDLRNAFNNHAPNAPDVAVNPDGTITIGIDGGMTKYDWTPEFYPMLFDLLQEDDLGGFNPNITNIVYPKQFNNWPDTIYDSVDWTYWKITDGVKQALGEVQRKCWDIEKH